MFACLLTDGGALRLNCTRTTVIFTVGCMVDMSRIVELMPEKSPWVNCQD